VKGGGKSHRKTGFKGGDFLKFSEKKRRARRPVTWLDSGSLLKAPLAVSQLGAIYHVL
jgi:hypothetical protein